MYLIELAKRYAFNCTIEELKHVVKDGSNNISQPFNCTIEELKLPITLERQYAEPVF